MWQDSLICVSGFIFDVTPSLLRLILFVCSIYDKASPHSHLGLPVYSIFDNTPCSVYCRSGKVPCSVYLCLYVYSILNKAHWSVNFSIILTRFIFL